MKATNFAPRRRWWPWLVLGVAACYAALIPLVQNWSLARDEHEAQLTALTQLIERARVGGAPPVHPADPVIGLLMQIERLWDPALVLERLEIDGSNGKVDLTVQSTSIGTAEHWMDHLRASGVRVKMINLTSMSDGMNGRDMREVSLELGR
jgi:hypothetical protein